MLASRLRDDRRIPLVKAAIDSSVQSNGGTPMPDEKTHTLQASHLRETALSRWENEGGAGSDGGQNRAGLSQAPDDPPPLTNAELAQLHIRVIALEGLVTALLAEASDSQLELVRDMAAYITPRPGFTDHPLTIRAAAQMVDLAERAGRFRAGAAAC